MPLPPNRRWLPLLLLVLACGQRPAPAQQVLAKPPSHPSPVPPTHLPTKPPNAPAAAKPVAAATPAASPAPVPDYGGRASPVLPTDAAGTAVPNPLAQAGRALEALVIVLVGVVGVLSLLKRASLGGGQAAPAWLKPMLGPKTPTAPAVVPAASPVTLTVVQSQTLPGAGGATLHLLAVGGKTLLLVGATPHNVNLLSEWDAEALKPSVQEARTEQAAFADYLTRAGVTPAPGPAHAAEGRIGTTADRLQDLLDRSRQHASEETPS